RNGEPITQALEATGIPFVVAGMTNLFGAAEAEAARQLFYFIADRPGVGSATVERVWLDAGVGVNAADLKRAIVKATQAKASLTDPDQKRWSLYSIQRLFLTFLEDAEVREERVPDDRGEIVFRSEEHTSEL